MRRLLKRKVVFKGKLIKLYLERQRYPGGYIADLEVVRHPGAILIVPFLDKNRIVMIKQYRPLINSYIWELPAGTLKKNERPLACAKRELKEEISYQAKTWKRRSIILPSPGYSNEQIIIFEARNLKKVASVQEEDELIISQIFTKTKIKQLFQCGHIVDAKTICALRFAHIL
jgi:ADP-ribose pyrophosphatase